MRILLLLENIGKINSASVKITSNILSSFSGANEVIVISKSKKSQNIDDIISSKFKKVIVVNNSLNFLDQKQYKQNGKFKNKCIFISNKLKAIFNIVFKRTIERINTVNYISKINRELNNDRYDVVMGNLMPEETVYIFTKLSTKAKKIVFQLDPYSNNKLLPANKKEARIQAEAKMKNSIDALICLDYLKYSITESEKTYFINLPLINNEPTKRSSNTKNEISYVFAGSFVKGCREPNFLLELFKRLPANHHLHIYGGGANFDSIIEKYENKYKNIHYYGWKPHEEVICAIENANILVNIDNEIDNQLPSKIVEYINTGKPIINMSKKYNSLTHEYLDKYELFIDVIDKTEDIDRNLDKAISFSEENKNKVLSKNAILSKFNKCTLKEVSKETQAIIESICKTNLS